MRKTIIVGAAAAAAVGGVGAGVVATQPAVAQEAENGLVERAAEHIREALAGLVEDGTISAEQADAVAEELATHRPERKGPRGFGAIEEVAGVLDLTPDAVFDRLRAGETLAEIAAAQGVSTDALAEVMVAAAADRLEAAVESGVIDEADAADRLDDIEEHVDDVINGEFVPRHRRGHGGAGGDGGSDADVGA